MFEDKKREAEAKIRKILSVEPKTNLNIQVPESLHEVLKYVAWQQRTTQTKIIQALIRERFKDELQNFINNKSTSVVSEDS